MDDKAREKRNKYAREWRKANRDRVNRERRERYKKDPDLRKKNRERVKAWKDADPERSKLSKKRSYDKNKVLIGRPKGEDHHGWKGENAGYNSIHRWVDREKGSPKKCEHCGTESAKAYDWANIDHKYKRNLDDYIRLCRSCHRRYDYENGLSKPRQRKLDGQR